MLTPRDKFRLAPGEEVVLRVNQNTTRVYLKRSNLTGEVVIHVEGATVRPRVKGVRPMLIAFNETFEGERNGKAR